MDYSTTILRAAEVIGALTIIAGAVFGLVKWILKQNILEEKIRKITDEQMIMCFALKACLDGLEQLGANHTVPLAKNELEKHLNKMAHDKSDKKE